MNIKKLLPLILLIVMAVITIAVKRCNNAAGLKTQPTTTKEKGSPERRSGTATNPGNTRQNQGLDRNPENLFFTKHAKCRMK